MFEVTLKPFLLVLAAVALILVNGIFVAAEFAIVRVRRTRLEELLGQGVEAAKDAILLVDHVTEYLAVTQIAITAASLGVGWIGEDAFASLFLLLLPASRVPSALLHVAAAIVAFFLITMMHVVLGELVPKNLAHQGGRASPALSRSAAADPAYRLTPVPLAFRDAVELDFAMHGSWENLPSATHGG